MRVTDRVALWRYRRRLRSLQARYYRGSASDAGATAMTYMNTLAGARSIWMKGTTPRRARVHLGSGDHHLDGWINVDITRGAADVLADLTTSLPFRTSSVDLLHSEDLLEHVDDAAGKQLLRECHRVLKPGG